MGIGLTRDLLARIGAANIFINEEQITRSSQFVADLSPRGWVSGSLGRRRDLQEQFLCGSGEHGIAASQWSGVWRAACKTMRPRANAVRFMAEYSELIVGITYNAVGTILFFKVHHFGEAWFLPVIPN